MDLSDASGAAPGNDTPGSFRAAITRRPVLVFCLAAVGLVVVLQFALVFAGLSLVPGKLAELLVLPGLAIGITALIGGRAAVRGLLAGLLRWRLGVARWLLVVLAIPALTVGVGLVTGTYRAPGAGWGTELANYLVLLLLIGLTASVWEETAWSGFVQTRLTRRYGLLGGAMLTAVPFAVIHVPLAFENNGLAGTALTDAWITWAFVFGTAPFFRYIAGGLLIDTGGSILAVAVLHASFNASGALTAVPGGWQYAVALVVLAVLNLVVRAARGRSVVAGTFPVPPAPAGQDGDQRAAE